MKTLGVDELSERLKEILRKVEEEGETFEVSDHGKVIAQLVPVRKPQQPDQRDQKTSWQEIDRLAAEIGKYLPEKVDVVEIMRDVRRDF